MEDEKNKHQKRMCLEENGQRRQICLSAPYSMVNTIGTNIVN